MKGSGFKQLIDPVLCGFYFSLIQYIFIKHLFIIFKIFFSVPFKVPGLKKKHHYALSLGSFYFNK